MKKVLYDSGVFIFKHKKSLVRVYCSDIVFFESRGHYINIHMKNGEVHRIRSTMTMLKGVLDGRFMKIRRGIIVNVEYVKAIEGNDVMLDSVWKSVPVSRPFRDELEKCL